MKLPKEIEKKFNQLNQLDRIEFRQKYDNIGRNFFISLSNTMGIIGIYLGLKLIYLTVLGLNYLSDPLLLPTMGFCIYFFIFHFIGNIINSRNKHKLYSEYWDFEIKEKKKK